MRKSASRIATDTGTMKGCAALVATLSPSTAEITEIAGVMIPSPKSMAAPVATTIVTIRPSTGCRTSGAGEREQREDAALAFVIDAHQAPDVLHADDERQEPQQQRQDAQHVLQRRLDCAVVKTS